MNKQELIDTYTKPQEYDPSVLGSFLPHDIGYQTFADLDGTHARAFLESIGFDVVKNVDTGHNGWAITADGYRLSTNGWFCRVARPLNTVKKTDPAIRHSVPVSYTPAKYGVFNLNGQQVGSIIGSDTRYMEHTEWKVYKFWDRADGSRQYGVEGWFRSFKEAKEYAINKFERGK